MPVDLEPEEIHEIRSFLGWIRDGFSEEQKARRDLERQAGYWEARLKDANWKVFPAIETVTGLVYNNKCYLLSARHRDGRMAGPFRAHSWEAAGKALTQHLSSLPPVQVDGSSEEAKSFPHSITSQGEE